MIPRQNKRAGAARGKAMLSLVVALTLTAAPTAARAGFFEQLFGVPVPAPVPQAEPDYSTDGRVEHGTDRPRPHRRKSVASKSRSESAKGAAKLQTPTPLMADKTLRPGDAVMLSDGLRIYSGPIADRHEDRQFVPLAKARVPSATRAALAMLSKTPDEPVVRVYGRSVAVSGEKRDGIAIPDVRAGSVRLVGP